jgi:hypothetical protein
MDRSLKAGDLPLVARTTDGYILRTRRQWTAFCLRPRHGGRLCPPAARRRWPAADLRSTVLLANVPPLSAAARRPGKARIVSYRNTEVVLEADSPDGGWVVLNDLWHPWWSAEIDGRPAELLRANVLFRAVAVPPGRHQVRFLFRPIAGAWAQLRKP